MTPGIPVLVRVAGLSARALERLGEPRLGETLEEIEELRQALDRTRDLTAERIYRQLPEAEPEERRFLLALKRDCHNRRAVAGRTGQNLWPRAVARTDGDLARVAEREAELAARQGAFAELYSEVRERERRALFELAEQPWLCRGLALASPDLMEGLSRHAEEPAPSRRGRRLETSLLRYVSRAALKTSPYSTLTPVALATLDSAADAEGVEGIRFAPGARRDRSLVRVKRYLLDQICRLLFRHPPVRENLALGLNPTLEHLATGEYRFLRPANLLRAEGDGRLEKSPPAQVTVRLGGDLVPLLCRLLAGGDLPLSAVLAAAASRLGGAEPSSVLATGIRPLLDLGFLEVRPPWPSYEPHLEACLLRFLESLPPAATPPGLLAALRELVLLEQGFAAAADPTGTVRRIDDLVLALHREAHAALDPRGEVPLLRAESRNYYEDVFLAPAAEERPFLLDLAPASLLRALAAGDLVWRLGYLFEPRHEALFALEHHLAIHHPRQSRVPAAQLFAETRRLWAAYRRHVDERRPGSFTPQRSPGLDELDAARARVERALAEPFPVEDGTERVPADLLESLVAAVPRRFLPAVGPCYFLEPCDPRGESWVANDYCEGTGRMSCRFNVALDPASRDRYVAHYVARSALDDEGERLEIVDMLFTQANTVNTHWPQTRRVLQMPGEVVALPRERILQLTDLYIERREGRPLRLVTGEGEAILPCFLSPLDFALVPTALRFLDLFGVRPERPLSWGELPEEGEGWRMYRRRQVDNLVLCRQKWQILPQALPRVSPGEEGFAALQRWRVRLGLPREVYFLGRDQGPAGAQWKPQYVDFLSPSFAALFAAGIDPGRPLTLFEALPRPADFPLDPQEGPRIFEVLLEALALRQESPLLRESPCPLSTRGCL